MRKILRAKASLGLQRTRLVDISTMIGSRQPQNAALAQEISDDAITLVRDNGKVLPLKAIKKSAVPLPYKLPVPIPIASSLWSLLTTCDWNRDEDSERQLHMRAPDAHIFYVDSRIAGAMSADILKAADEAETVMAAVYAVAEPWRSRQRSPVNARTHPRSAAELFSTMRPRKPWSSRWGVLTWRRISPPSKITVHILIGACLGNQRGQSALRRDPNSWPFARQHSGSSAKGRGHRAADPMNDGPTE